MDLSNSPPQKCNCVQEMIYTFFYFRCKISQGGYQSKREHQEMFFFSYKLNKHLAADQSTPQGMEYLRTDHSERAVDTKKV